MDNPFAGTNLDGIKEMNIAAVLKKIHGEKGISRIDIASCTGMSCAFVTKVLAKLIAEGVVTEERKAVSERGRPKVALSFNFKKYAMLGLRINKKYVSSALCTADGELLCRYSVSITDSFTAEDVLNACCEIIKKAEKCAEESADGRRILGLGIAAPGPLPVSHDRVTTLNDGAFCGFSDYVLTDYFKEKLGYNTVLLHDAHCGALNEYIFSRQGVKYRNIVFLASDNGVGAGIILDGHPFNGAGGLAGEVANMLIRSDDGMTGFDSILSQSRLLDLCGCSSMDECIEAVKRGGSAAVSAFDSYVTSLAVIAVNFVFTVSPQAVVISDKIALLSDRVSAICREVFDKYLPGQYRDSVEIIVRPYDKHSVLRGACVAVLHRALEEPCRFFLS